VTAGDLELGRGAYSERAWRDAYDLLSSAEAQEPLAGNDLELLARSAYMLGCDDDYVAALERAHHEYLDRSEHAPAVRCAFWIGHNMLFRGEAGPAAGWFARGQRLLDRFGAECAERGYLLIPILLQHSRGGDFAAAHETAVEMTAIGERFGDRDLAAIGLMEQGHALVRSGRAEDGLRLVDETMVAVTIGELSPIVSGIVYCNTIAFCRETYEVRRAREWTSALTRWCERQPEMVAHNGLCLVHRAEIMTLGGAWSEALQEATRVGERFAQGVLNQRALGHAAYRQGEVHRLRGEFGEAEAAYREASRLGREPQPGLALLHLARGKTGPARTAIARAVRETGAWLQRAALLPACVDVALAASDVEEARRACAELEEIAARQPSEALAAMAAYARGALALAEGDPDGALDALRRAERAWQALEAPYEVARTRALAALACRSLGDEETARLELGAARDAFATLGATPDVHRMDALAVRPAARRSHGLTARELEVLRLLAAGKSNREIASELVISDHTVRRHLQNIFRKLDVSSRAAATAFAFRHDLV
jgi:DNA-binding NarL/FixJ family response regulator